MQSIQHYGTISGPHKPGTVHAFDLRQCSRCGLHMVCNSFPVAGGAVKAEAAGFSRVADAAILPKRSAFDTVLCERCAHYTTDPDALFEASEVVARTAWDAVAWLADDERTNPHPPDLLWSGDAPPPTDGERVRVRLDGEEHTGTVRGLVVSRGEVVARVDLDRDPDPERSAPRWFEGCEVTPLPPAEAPTVEQLSTVVQTVERVWRMIGERHDLDPVAISITTGNRQRQRGSDSMRWGHFAADRWAVRDGRQLHEVMIAGELLALSGEDVLETLLHEAAHAAAHRDGVKDTSRGGRYHNKRFKNYAERMGLTVERGPRHGWHVTSLPIRTATDWRDAVALLNRACDLHAVGGWEAKHAPGGEDDEGDGGDDLGDAEGDDKPKRGGLTLWCQCPEPRKIRVAQAVAEVAAIRCDACGETFQELN